METSCSEPVPEVVQGCDDEHVLPVVVASAGRIATQRRWSPPVCPSRYQAGPLSHGQTHDQHKRRVGWSFRADFASTVAAIGAWRSAPVRLSSTSLAPTCAPAATPATAFPK